jgi:signal transduction histidine kinase
MAASSPEHLRNLKRLFDVSRLLSQASDMDALLNIVIQTSNELTDSLFSSILLYEQETDTLKFIACHPDHKKRLHQFRIPIERSLSGSVYKSQKSIRVQNAGSDPRILAGPEQEFGYPAQTALIVPMVYRGESIGILEAIQKRSNQQFSFNDMEILEILAFQVAASILGHLLYDEIKHAYDEVQALEKLKSNFIAIASHELRTPLGLILGHASYMNELIQNPELKEQLEVIIRSANRLKSIIEDLSNVNNYQSGMTRLHHRSVSLTSLITRVTQAFLPTAEEKSIRLITQLPKNELVFDGDEEKITIALSNLVKNALTFTDQGGRILVIAEKLTGYIQVCVADTGIGIPSSDLPHVFDRFFQVDSHLTRRHGGMGLGLSVAKAMIELHKGQIWVESEVGKGSKFSFLLPVQHLSAPQGRVKAFIENE